MIRENPAAGKMSFEEWLKQKEDEERRVTHNAETVKDRRLYALEQAVIKVCFDDKVPFMNLYYIPPALDTGAAGLYGGQRIMISKPFFVDHGIDDDTIALMFHEVAHAYCDIKGIKATAGKMHLQAFAQVCEANKGTCEFISQQVGFNEARPTAEAVELIKAELRARSMLPAV